MLKKVSHLCFLIEKQFVYDTVQYFEYATGWILTYTCTCVAMIYVKLVALLDNRFKQCGTSLDIYLNFTCSLSRLESRGSKEKREQLSSPPPPLHSHSPHARKYSIDSSPQSDLRDNIGKGNMVHSNVYPSLSLSSWKNQCLNFFLLDFYSFPVAAAKVSILLGFGGWGFKNTLSCMN